MKNIFIKRIIVGFISISLLLTTALLSGCGDGKNYDEEIANLKAQIDELKKEHEQFAADHKEIMDKLEGEENSESDETTDADEAGSTTSTTTTTKKKNDNTTKSSTTTKTTKKPDDDGFGTEVGM